MSKNTDNILKSLPARILQLSVGFGTEPDEKTAAMIERDLLSPTGSPTQAPGKMLLIDLFLTDEPRFRPLMEFKATTDFAIIHAFDNGMPDKLAGKSNLISFCWLTGTTFKDVKENIAGMKDLILAGTFTGIIKLIPDPSNTYDPNCINVTSEDGGRLGYVPMKTGVNKEVKLHMEQGRFITAQLAMLENGKKGPMIGIAMGWNMPEELLVDDSIESPPAGETSENITGGL